MKKTREWKNKKNKKLMTAIAVMDPASQYNQTKNLKAKIKIGKDIASEIDLYIQKEREQGHEPTSYRLTYYKEMCLTDYLSSQLRYASFVKDPNSKNAYMTYRGIMLVPY